VNQRFEHLSDAQIEQFGKRASGAGPETEAWVESHLDDCSSCRSRVLEFQRAQFALLPDPKVNTVSTSDCSSEDDLRNLAAGLCAEPIAKKLKAHASNCERCGPLLQEYIEDFSDESSLEEQASLAQLRSASPEWQRQKAREMLRHAASTSTARDASAAGASAAEAGSSSAAATFEPDEKTPARKQGSSAPGRKSFFWKWVLVPVTAAVVAVAAFSIWYSQRDTPEKVEKLLAQAYTEQRTMELRWPGADYTALSPQQRGNLGHQPASLFRAKSIILTRLGERKNDAEWLRALGREEILEWHTDDAINDLNRALELSPNSVSTMVDLAMAHFQRAERLQDIADYRQSVELLGKALTAQPDDPVILFNRALVYQKMSPPLYESAVNDWNRFLVIESRGPWSEEARQHKREIEELKKNSSVTN
jgi:tetratricopeptide (TPR) repeat protein